MSHFKLWYNQPATGWSQGLPIGNGRIGAVIHESADKETWNLTEVTYWSGKSERITGSPNGKAELEKMRAKFFSGDYAAGDRLAKQVLQPKKQNYGTHLSLCDIQIQYQDSAVELMRELDLETAIAQTTYTFAGYKLVRETFASHPAGIVVSRISGDQPAKVSFTLGVEGRTSTFDVTGSGESLVFSGQATEDIHSDGKCGVLSQGEITVRTKGGSIQCEHNNIVVSGADEAVIYFAVQTDYGQSGQGWIANSRSQVQAAITKGFNELKHEHLADYQALYQRVKLDLGSTVHDERPLTERIGRLRKGHQDDPGLVALFYQYGRYLTIAGSREDSPLPLNLQGIWNDGEANRMAWSCDYHLDVNTQMNYYPTEVSNLADSHVPLMHYIEQLAVAGRLAAQDFYGCEGWVAHVFSNAWGFSAPGWETSWGLNVTGGLWIATHMIEHYEYTLDQEFLTKQAYPVLKEAAAFFLDYMVIHPEYGWLVTGPSNSPENTFYPGSPEEGGQQLSMGSTMDQMLVRDLFVFVREAAELLQVDQELQSKLTTAIGQLPPLQIGKRGQLQEWLEDYEEAQPEHRHFSHLYGLYPGSQITPDQTPELSEATRTMLYNRMEIEDLEDIEFTAALFALGFSRLHDGERAAKHISHLIGELCFDNLLSYSKPGVAGAETNIFVIDGNFGGTAAIADMLLQSREGQIHLLPALPQLWPSGSYEGLRAKGNAEVSVSWENRHLVSATIKAFSDGSVLVRSGTHAVQLELEAGRVYELDGLLQLVAVIIS